MFENRYPLFNSGRLLKIDMLEELRNFPREFFNAQFKGYSDGIISGCDIEISDNYIKILKGIIKYEGIIYLLKEDSKIEYICNNKLMVLKVKFLPEMQDSDFRINSTEIYLSENLNSEANELEICRFKLRTGAKLRINHTDFTDLNTEYDTVNTIYAPYSAYGKSSLNPEILRRFGQELLECNLNEAWDISFVISCVQSKEAIQKEIIVSYLVYKLNIEMKDYSNEDLYYYLLNVLHSMKDGASGHGRRGGGKFKKILID
ncbi:hypothetical protein CLOBY_08250 [Clostridium saccharobutylicum]|uniref:DNA and RNA helicase n=1 Tax=Clostridium saccharobutylicum TaxID=169679 RepID=A0A1S8N5J1_CLOSA|nr:hypothetical protein [Clostridium saccharobutylicum]AQS08715.1 hypothetical protein CLOBY_08250 [Clostridium saccharobutylicum]MBC2437240.1 hypothetical protein [Clostridium saccharobutylicum]NSB89623.1 hypothetical protein [Clostridium saccharobutylicum]NYC28940.1 hypothetical protein [Clostridium saccharobutylicum]OOM11690.1 hypothetical protein CLOSAC_21170 [Clostridium saccharobutylicum]